RSRRRRGLAFARDPGTFLRTTMLLLPSTPAAPLPATRLTRTTAVSEVGARFPYAPAPTRAMARSSLLVALLAMSTTGCLITSTPQFQPQEHTAPFLVATTADPDSRSLVILDAANKGTTNFKAEVISQDDQPGSGGLFQKVL